jgi:hypothetical protein
MQNHWLLLGAVLLLGIIDVTSSYKVWQLAKANGKFALCLYDNIIDGQDGKNKFFSPFRYHCLSRYNPKAVTSITFMSLQIG